MACKLFSFLGTSKYEPCYYYLENAGQLIQDDKYCCYVQEALVNLLPQVELDIEEIVVYLTDEAYESNWIKNRNEESGLPGLQEALEKSSGSKNVKGIRVASGTQESELWEIFHQVYNQIEAEDKIIFDITHSFRSLPILVLVILNYAKFVKNCEIVGIYYGAIEALCSPQQLKTLPAQERLVPVFDLTAFVELLDWTVGIAKFLDTGDLRQILAMLELERRKFGKKGEPDNARFFEELKNALEQYVTAIATCRGPALAQNIVNLRRKLETTIDSPKLVQIEPVKPLLEMVHQELSGYSNEEDLNMLQVVNWCREHNLIQQGITILQEGLVTLLCRRFDKDPTNEGERELFSQIGWIFRFKKEETEWKEELILKRDFVYKVQGDEVFQAVEKLLDKMGNARNDINHAGWRAQPLSAKKIERNLSKFVAEAEQIIRDLD